MRLSSQSFLLILLQQSKLAQSKSPIKILAYGESGSPISTVTLPNVYPPPRKYEPGEYSPSEKSSSELYYEKNINDDFRSRDSRMAFIRKVYAIFASQMASTVIITAAIMLNYDLAYFLQMNYKPMLIASSIGSIGVLTALTSSPKLRYTSPINFILLGIYSLLQGITVGSFASLFDPKMVCIGTMHTLTALLAITAYTFQPNPKYDLTSHGNALLASLITLAFGSFVGYFLKIPLLDNVISALLAILTATYIAYDTQKIIGGKAKNPYGKREYILAALGLYQDVIQLFIRIMILLHKTSDREGDS